MINDDDILRKAIHSHGHSLVGDARFTAPYSLPDSSPVHDPTRCYLYRYQIPTPLLLYHPTEQRHAYKRNTAITDTKTPGQYPDNLRISGPTVTSFNCLAVQNADLESNVPRITRSEKVVVSRVGVRGTRVFLFDLSAPVCVCASGQ